jgi:hypothetical protein
MGVLDCCREQLKIVKKDYVNMAELLSDNLEAYSLGLLQDPATNTSSSPKCLRREILDLSSWVQCFGTYMGMFTSKFPKRTKQLLAYLTLIWPPRSFAVPQLSSELAFFENWPPSAKSYHYFTCNTPAGLFVLEEPSSYMYDLASGIRELHFHILLNTAFR